MWNEGRRCRCCCRGARRYAQQRRRQRAHQQQRAASSRRCGVVHAPSSTATPQGLFKYHQYQVVGRHNPTTAEPNPTVYRMKVWAPDAVCAKSKFW
jgi:hypothetical protein